MATSKLQASSERKRKAHAKSRKGCGNCKLRRVKCDEGRPECQRCLSYSVSCNYDKQKASLHLCAQGSFQVELAPEPVRLDKVIEYGMAPPVSINQTMVAMANDCLNLGSLDMGTSDFANVGHWHAANFYTFSEYDLAVMQRFMDRTSLTVGTKRTAPAYRDCIYHLAFQHPFLMHMVLSLTLLHDAYLATHSDTLAKTYMFQSLRHWTTATRLYNRVLSGPVKPTARDAIWGTGALIGAAVFATIDTHDPTAAWPLKSPEPNDLTWLKLNEGKKAIFKIADPRRPDSIFHPITREQNFETEPDWMSTTDLSALPLQVLALFNITPSSSIHNNAYHIPVITLERLRGRHPTHENILDFLFFMSYMTRGFRALLEVKDPRSLLLLAWWFWKLERGELWWMARRAKVEGEGIRVWLQSRWAGADLDTLLGVLSGDPGLDALDVVDLLGVLGPGLDVGVGGPSMSADERLACPVQ